MILDNWKARSKVFLNGVYYNRKFAHREPAGQFDDQYAVFCLHGFHRSFRGIDYGLTARGLLSRYLRSLSTYYRFVSLSGLTEMMEEENRPSPAPCAAVTIDDGYESTLSVIDVFRKYGITPTIFICPGLMEERSLPFPEVIKIAFLMTGKTRVKMPSGGEDRLISGMKDRMQLSGLYIEWFKRISPEDLPQALSGFMSDLGVGYEDLRRSKYYDPLLRWDQILELKGLVEIGSHTCHHYHLSSIPDSAARDEIGESKAMIEDKLGTQCVSLAYPFGDQGSFTQRELADVRDAGYGYAFSLEPGYVLPAFPSLALPRFNIGNGLRGFVRYRESAPLV